MYVYTPRIIEKYYKEHFLSTTSALCKIKCIQNDYILCVSYDDILPPLTGKENYINMQLIFGGMQLVYAERCEIKLCQHAT